jgi:carboxyl-terminal processing protease
MKFRKPSRAATTLAVVMAAFVATTIVAQSLADAKSDDAITAKQVATLVAEYHISQKKIDETISGKMFDQFIKQLDPSKRFFTKSDVDKLKTFRPKIALFAKEGNVQFAYDTFELYRKRTKERMLLAHQLIDAPHDFTIDESMVIDPDKLDWTDSPKELRERWRKRIKADILSLKLEKEPMDKIKDRLHKRYRNIERSIKQMERYEIFEMYLSSLTHAYDPHSSYMSPQTVEDFTIIMKLQLQGIGASLRSEDGYTVVANIVEGGAADKDKRLKTGDRIIAVDQDADGPDPWVDIVEMKLSKVVRYIRGKAGTKVRLKVKKADVVDKKTGKTTKGKIEVYDLTRQVIQLHSSEVKGEIIHSKDRLGGADVKIGVINIPSFYRDFEGARLGLRDFKSTSADVKKVLKEFESKGGVDLVVIDLRNNGGGALTEAIEVSGLFIDKGPVVQVKTLSGEPRTHDDVESGTAWDGPLVVVCNKLSASASEIFAGVIKDYKRGVIVGDKSTHGKGTVQNVMPVGGRSALRFLKPDDRGALKLTIQQFYRVNGDSTQNRGVESDVVLPSIYDYMDLGESHMDNALKFSRVAPADYKPVNRVTPEIVKALDVASAQRVAKDKEFQKTLHEIKRIERRKNRKKISLNERIRREEIKDEKTTPGKDDDPDAVKKGPIFPKESYNDEVLRVSVDYLGMLKSLKTAGK